MGIVLKGGIVVTAVDIYEADIRIDDGRIAAIGHSITQPGDDIIDVVGDYLFPGGIDPHTHFDLPVGTMRTADDFISGTKAAVIGGTTTIIDFATQFKGETLRQALDNWHRLADDKCYADYGFHLAITDWHNGIAREMPSITAEQGVTSFKLYMAYKNILQVDDGTLLAAFQQAGQCGALICLHCENGDIIDALVQAALAEGKTAPRYHAATRPVEVEEEATRRAIMIAKIASAPLYIVHLTCAGALTAVEAARQRGQPVYAETCPQYMLLDETYYDQKDFSGAKYVISPPLRSRENQPLLWQGLKQGSIATVATDHCSFHFTTQKDVGRCDFSKIPNGMPGVEHRMALLYTYGVVRGRLSLTQFVAVTSTNAAKLFGVYPRKGTIAVGSDADILVWDPAYESVIRAAGQTQNVDYSPFEEFLQQGRPRHVFLRGKQVVADGRLTADKPGGRYLCRNLFGVGGM